MELYQLETFVAVARAGHLTRAAERLFLSQPTVSGHIKALEDELGVVLFTRTPKGMLLTRTGELLLEQAERALQATRAIVSQAQRLKSELVGAVLLGTVSEPVALRLGDFLSAMVAAHPALELRLSQGVSGTVLEGVRAGALDAGYVLSDERDSTLEWIRLAPVALFIVGPARWAEAIRAADWEALGRLPWIGTPPACSFHRIAQGLFAAHGVSPAMVTVADQEATLRSLAASGVGMTLMREDQALEAERQGDVVRWPGAAHRTSLWFVCRTDRREEPLIQALLGAVRGTWS